MRRLLRLSNAPTLSAAQARSAFQKSLVSGRLLDASSCTSCSRSCCRRSVSPSASARSIGIVIGLLAMVSIVYSIRRFWRADHSKRWHYTMFGSLIIVFLIWATIADTIRLFD